MPTRSQESLSFVENYELRIMKSGVEAIALSKVENPFAPTSL
jgi:hypothetical protein